MYPPNLNVPLPEPETLAPEQPNKMQQALSMIVPLFSLGTALGGSPQAGAAFLHGAHQTLQRQKQESEQKAYQQQQLAVRQQQIEAQYQARMMAEQQARQVATQKLFMDTANAVRGKSREEYEQIIGQNEQMGSMFLGLPPNRLRSAIPWMAPNAETVMAKAGEAFLKNPANKEAIEQGKLDGSVLVDVQGDGKPIPVSVRDVLKASGVQFDPQSGAPLVMPKEEKKPTGVQLDDEAFLGEVAKFEAEKKRKATPEERGQIAVKVKRMMEKPSATGQSGTGDAEAIAESIMRGEQPPDLKGLYRMGPAVRASLAAKGYNLATAQTDWQATQRHIATLNGQQQTRMRQAIDNAAHSLDVIEELADQWKGGKFPILNRGRLAAAKAGTLGPQAQQIATALEAQIADVTAELANVYMGGNSPTDHAMKLAAHNLSADWSESQLRKLIQQQRMNLQIRSNSMSNIGVQGASATNPYGPQTPAADTGVEVVVRGPDGKLIVKKGGQ